MWLNQLSNCVALREYIFVLDFLTRVPNFRKPYRLLELEQVKEILVEEANPYISSFLHWNALQFQNGREQNDALFEKERETSLSAMNCPEWQWNQRLTYFVFSPGACLFFFFLFSFFLAWGLPAVHHPSLFQKRKFSRTPVD